MPPVRLPFLLGPLTCRCSVLILMPVAGHQVVQEVCNTDGFAIALLAAIAGGPGELALEQLMLPTGGPQQAQPQKEAMDRSCSFTFPLEAFMLPTTTQPLYEACIPTAISTHAALVEVQGALVHCHDHLRPRQHVQMHGSANGQISHVEEDPQAGLMWMGQHTSTPGCSRVGTTD